MRLLSVLRFAVLRWYIYVSWNFLMAWEILAKRRESWILIEDLRVVYEEDGLIVLNKHPNLLINDVHPWRQCLTLQMQVSNLCVFFCLLG